MRKKDKNYNLHGVLLAIGCIMSAFIMMGQPDTSDETSSIVVSESVDNESTTGAMELSQAQNDNVSVTSTLEVHFIDVGQALSILVSTDGHYMLYDAGNAADEDLLFAYLDELSVDSFDLVIASHPHEDHIGGMSAVLSAYECGLLWMPDYSVDSACYQKLVSVSSEKSLTCYQPELLETYALGEAIVTVLGPVTTDYEDLNNVSIVVRIDFGSTSFLLTGDSSVEAETDMCEAGLLSEVDVLQVSHHGSASSTSYRFIREVNPYYGVISVGEGNSYGHPTDLVLSRLSDAGCYVYRTDESGTIVFSSDGITVSTEQTGTAPAQEHSDGLGLSDDNLYIANSSSMIFHSSDCTSLPSERSRVYFSDRNEALEAGYSACGRCRP